MCIIHEYTHTHTHRHIYVCTCVWMCECKKYVCVCVCVCVCVWQNLQPIAVSDFSNICVFPQLTCACYVVKKTWRRKDRIVAALTAIFCLQREPNLKSGRILVIIRMLRDSWSRMAALPAGAARRKLLRGTATHPIYLLSLYDHHPQLFSECKVS